MHQRATDNVCSRKFFAWLSAEFAANRVHSIMLATPCSSFSIAVSRSGVALRSREHPRGIPKPMSLAQLNRIDQGNKALDATIKIIRLCNQHRVPYILENPALAYLWFDPALRCVIINAFIVDVDQCAFKAPWKKTTKLCCGNFRSSSASGGHP